MLPMTISTLSLESKVLPIKNQPQQPFSEKRKRSSGKGSRPDSSSEFEPTASSPSQKRRRRYARRNPVVIRHPALQRYVRDLVAGDVAEMHAAGTLYLG